MSRLKPAKFNQELVDDILLSPPSLRNEIEEILNGCSPPNSIGPTLEYEYGRSGDLMNFSSIYFNGVSSVVDAFREWKINSRGYNRKPLSSLSPQPAEFQSYLDIQEDGENPLAIAFWKRLENAARNCGFGNVISAGLTGAAKEMADNIEVHSGKTQTGLIGYRWSRNEFEFAVADRGIGILQSLRSNRRYGSLTDHGEAVRLAMSGKSRFGPGTGHGYGFRQLFISLASLNGSVRFRSGDDATTLLGDSVDSSNASSLQRSYLQGFVLSVTCRC